MSKKKYIYIFAERGANYLPVYCRLKESFKEQDIEVKPVFKADLLKKGGFSADNVLAFFLPGATLKGEYDVRLGDDGFEAVRSYVQKGGNFIGICGGAYYASYCFEWCHEHHEHASTKTPSLRFFNGLAKGPISAITSHYDWNTLKAVTVCSDDKDLGIFKMVYWGGPEFLSYDRFKGYQVWASFYEKGVTSPCVIHRKEGRGTITLSSVHPELSEKIFNDLLSPDQMRQLNVKEVVEQSKPSRKKQDLIWGRILGPVRKRYYHLKKKRDLLYPVKKGIQ